MRPEPIVLNSKGEQVKLNAQERLSANFWRMQIKNSLGYDIPITSLTTIVKKISEQKFYQIFPADYFPVVAGEGAWSDFLTTYRSFQSGGTFEAGILNLGGQNSRLASTDAGVDAVNTAVYDWAKENTWSVIELQKAAKSGNWDLVAAKEETRKTNWDLGIQRVAFLGANGLNASGGSCLGLLNQPGVTTDTTTISKLISSMTAAELATLCANIIAVYRQNVQYSAWPDVFAVPEFDYNGLATQSSPTYPIKSILQVLEETFQVSTRNKNFKILPLAYANPAAKGGGSGSNYTYTLLRYDEKSVRMNVPVPYTATVANSLNGFQFQNAAYGEFTGVTLLRPLEMMYFTHT